MEGETGDKPSRVGGVTGNPGTRRDVSAGDNPHQAQSTLGLDVTQGPGPTASQLLSKNLQATITYCSVFWSFGMCVALLGPTIEDLGCQTESTLADMSWAFLSQSLCTLIGSMIGGLLVDRLPADPLLLCSTIMIATTIALIPFCHTLSLLLVNLAVMGIFMGIIDTVANVSLLRIYGKLVSPFLQALHFCYGLGAFISPIVAEPFLINKDCSSYVSPNSTSDEIIIPVLRDLSQGVTEPHSTMDGLERAKEGTRVRYAFWIMSLIQLPIIILVLMLLCKKRCIDPVLGRGQAATLLVNRALYEDLDKGPSTKEKTFADQHAFSSKKAVFITVLLCLILFLYDGLQAGYGGFIFAYAVRNSHIEVSASDGAYMTSVFWGSFALGRLLSIPISTRCSLSLMLLCNMLGCLIALSIEVIIHDSLSILYIASALFGVSLSSIYPTSVALAEQNINMTGLVTSCLVIAAASGEMAFPIFVGRVLFNISPFTFLRFALAITIFGMFLYIALFMTSSCTESKASNAVKNIPVAENALVWCRRNCCLTQSRESLLTGDGNYYTTLTDTTNAYTVVESSEQIPMDKMTTDTSPDDNSNSVAVENNSIENQT